MPLSGLECVKPGVRSGQILLAVDLTIPYGTQANAGQPETVLAQIANLGYSPTIRHVTYTSGVHVLAVLKEEQHAAPVDEDYWLEEWMQVRSQMHPDAVHLWRGK